MIYQSGKKRGKMHKIGIISDTHGLLRPQITEILSGCEAILHGGDIDKQEILDELKRIAPTYAVRGNTDGEWAKDIPESLSFELYGIKFYMIHNRKKMPKVLSEADVVIYGHSHKYEEKNEGRRLFLNPGSCGPKRFMLPVTMAVLEITDSGSYNVKRIEIPTKSLDDKKMNSFDTANQQELDENGLPKNIKQVIESVIKDTNRGIPVKEIAEMNGISENLAEQICRLYLTHPGVDADGIMTKMGI